VQYGVVYADAPDIAQHGGAVFQDLSIPILVSVWGANIAFPRELLESTKLVKFECYAEFTVTDAIRLRR
jgi:hypothetical protein